MAQLIKGTTYATNDQVTATNLNNLVDLGQLAPGCISEQTSASTVSVGDQLLLNQGGVLKKATVAQISGNFDSTAFLKTDGTTSMQAPLLLASTAAPAALNAAVPLAYVQSLAIPGGTAALSTLVQKSGDSMTGNLNMTAGSVVILGTIGTSSLSAVNKQYVADQISPLATAAQLSTHISNTSNPHLVDKNQVGLGNADNTSDLLKPVSNAVQTELNKKVNLDGNNTLTGVLALSTAAITGLYQATHKTYVDAADALKFDKTGGTITGPTNFTASAPLTLTAAIQTTASSAIAKSQLDAATIQRPRILASGFFVTSDTSSNVINESKFLSVTVTRTAGNSYLDVNFGGLAAKYKDSTKPFFVDSQRIGIKGVTGVQAGLYRISLVDYTNATFRANVDFSGAPGPTAPTTAISTPLAIQLSCVYDNVDETDVSSFNVKSVFIDLNAVSKYYVNYLTDTIDGSRTTVNQPLVSGCVAQGNAVSNGISGVCSVMRNVGRINNLAVNGNAEGVGANSMGCHIGFMSYGTVGINTNYVYQAAFAISNNR
jgi:hypothetical protein